MAFTEFATCANKNLALEQIEKLTLIADLEGKPLEKTAQVFNFQGGVDQVRKTDLSVTAFAVSSKESNLLGWNIINPNASVIYVKFYDVAAGSFNISTDVPKLTIMVKANDTAYIAPNAVQAEFGDAICMRACTGLADNDNTAPGTAIHVNAFFI